MNKNKLFDLLIEGKSFKIATSEQQKIVKRYNDIMICKEFGWTEYDIGMMSVDFYEDVLLLLNKQTAYQNRVNQENQR